MSINCVVNLCSSVDFRDWVSCLALDTFDKKRRPHRRGLRRQSFGLAPGLSHFVPLAARSDQSLPLDGGLLPQPLCGR